jgi:hypothetical protein
MGKSQKEHVDWSIASKCHVPSGFTNAADLTGLVFCYKVEQLSGHATQSSRVESEAPAPPLQTIGVISPIVPCRRFSRDDKIILA